MTNQAWGFSITPLLSSIVRHVFQKTTSFAATMPLDLSIVEIAILFDAKKFITLGTVVKRIKLYNELIANVI